MNYSPLQLADAFIQTGELADALDALNTHLEANNNDDDARRLRAAVLLRLPDAQHLHAALADINDLENLQVDDFVQQSVILQKMGDVSAACAAMQHAHELSPLDERITERFVELLARCGQLHTASQLVAAQSPTWRWLQLAGDLERDKGDEMAAAHHYAAAAAHLESQMDTHNDAVAANLKSILVTKLESLQK
ncbi:MAG: hypothetical protein R3E39_25165 [Anaerolineae bacterium]